MSNLAKRAADCKAWRWLPGMRGNDRGLMLRCMSAKTPPGLGQVRQIEFADEGQGRTHWHSWAEDSMPPIVPDLTDSATLGCLLELVRLAYDSPYVYVTVSVGEEFDTEDDLWSVRVPARYGSFGLGTGRTYAEALSAALLAAP